MCSTYGIRKESNSNINIIRSMITSTIKNNANDNTCKKNLRKNFFKSSPAVFSPIKIVLAFQCVVD